MKNMKTYDVFQQCHPKTMKLADGTTEWVSNLVWIGTVKAWSGAHAIEIARQTFEEFKHALRTTLRAFPIVKEQ